MKLSMGYKNVAIVLLLARCASGFSVESAQQTRGKLAEALSSPSSKLTISPEVLIPVPNDPTALLLQGTKVTQLSNQLRTKSKTNSIFLSGTMTSLYQVTNEQDEALGSFPGPIPVIYCATSSDDLTDEELWSDLAGNGCSGIFVTCNDGNSISCVDDFSAEEAWMKKALNVGIQPIPEIVLKMDKKWEEGDIDSILNLLADKCGHSECPVGIVLTLDTSHIDEVENEDPVEEEEEEDDDDGFKMIDPNDIGKEKEDVSASTTNDNVEKMNEVWENFPKLSRAMKKRSSILGSVRVDGSQLRDYTAQLKSKGFSGAFLRADCVPGFRLNPDLEFVGKFWTSVIADLKSTRSKSFGFRSKVALEKDIPMEWLNYQQDVMESGALGSTSSSAAAEGLDTENGDFVGF